MLFILIYIGFVWGTAAWGATVWGVAVSATDSGGLQAHTCQGLQSAGLQSGAAGWDATVGATDLGGLQALSQTKSWALQRIAC